MVTQPFVTQLVSSAAQPFWATLTPIKKNQQQQQPPPPPKRVLSRES